MQVIAAGWATRENLNADGTNGTIRLTTLGKRAQECGLG